MDIVLNQSPPPHAVAWQDVATISKVEFGVLVKLKLVAAPLQLVVESQ
jgi:hypothetical protein